MLLNAAEINPPFQERCSRQGRYTDVWLHVKHDELVKIQIRILFWKDKYDRLKCENLYDKVKHDMEDHFHGLEMCENIAYRQNMRQR